MSMSSFKKSFTGGRKNENPSETHKYDRIRQGSVSFHQLYVSDQSLLISYMYVRDQSLFISNT